MNQEIKKHLVELSEKSYRDFSAKLIPNISNILGIRLPKLRAYAKTLNKSKNFELNKFLQINDNEYMEFIMLQGFLIGLKDCSIEEFRNDITNFIPKIDNWAVCDTFCASLKQIKKYKSDIWEFLQPYLKSKKEYEIRFGAVTLLNYYITEDYIQKTLNALTSIKTDDYYAQMSIAWALSICYINFFDITHSHIMQSEISSDILKMTIRKVCESLRPTPEQKSFLKQYLQNKNRTL